MLERRPPEATGSEPLERVRTSAAERRLAAINRRKVKKIAFWVGMLACLVCSLAVIAGLVQGYYEMGHPPGGWCQDDSPKRVKP
ncbi:hypothetical protein [Streptomyces sp. MST-110588]|uniref:hypothetical protein n=1 Tax=Streptomyces sp. MST-110588 TaxID=2833628 RepID=UPI001F5D33AD|nr:hypothetical protein [Streptomyces sp. MST-110588]UNO40847.1 hypothetical protein KGS77_16250 [Streptomyces sp. MST-110588]